MLAGLLGNMAHMGCSCCCKQERGARGSCGLRAKRELTFLLWRHYSAESAWKQPKVSSPCSNQV